jgi:hypothetical protein
MLVGTCVAFGTKDKLFPALPKHRALHAEPAQICDTVACLHISARTAPPLSALIHGKARVTRPSKTGARCACAKAIH